MVSADHYLPNTVGRIDYSYGRFCVSPIYLYIVLKRTPEVAPQSAGRPSVTLPIVAVVAVRKVP